MEEKQPRNKILVKGPHASVVSLIFLANDERRDMRLGESEREKHTLQAALLDTESKTNMKSEMKAPGM